MDYTDFLAGGIASTGATLFTNPIEVIKTRIQLQGELAARGTYVENYKGVFHAFVTVAKNDGLVALQKGLAPALCFQFILNGFRGELSTCTQSVDNFLKDLKTELQLFLQHDHTAKSQTAFFSHAKKTIKEGEFVVCLDFAENFSFVIQDAVQAHHWSNKQVTLHPYVIYYKHGDEVNHHSFVIVSECHKHDSVAVNLFNRKMIQFLIDIHGKNSIKKLIFFSDGAAAQYKNKSNFINMTYLQKEIEAEVQWHFFATAHGKGACDGIGGTVKRNAYRASLQRPINSQITTPIDFFDWAKGFFKNISFDFCTTTEHEAEREKLQPRFSKATAIKCTRKYHSFQPAAEPKYILCKRISTIQNTEKHKIEI